MAVLFICDLETEKGQKARASEPKCKKSMCKTEKNQDWERKTLKDRGSQGGKTEKVIHRASANLKNA